MLGPGVDLTFNIESLLSSSRGSLPEIVSIILSYLVQRRVASSYEVKSASSSFFLMSVSWRPDISADRETSSCSSMF